MFYQNNDNTGGRNKTKTEHTGKRKITDATNQEASEMCKYGHFFVISLQKLSDPT